MNKIKILLLLILISNCPFSAKAGKIIKITESTRYLVPKGKSRDAIDGDWIMKNDKIIIVIGKAALGREANMRVQSVQGAVIDFTSLADNNDYLAAFYPQGYPAEDSRLNPVIFTNKIEVLKSKGSEIILRATRYPTDKVPYQSVTDYILKDGENFLRIRTTYFNESKQNAALTFGDKIRLDKDTKDASPIGKHDLVFMYNRWAHAAYGLYSPKGLFVLEEPITGSDPATGLLVSFHDKKNVILKPGQQITAVRYLLCGKDVAEIQRNIMNFNKTRASRATLKVADTNKKPIKDVFLKVFNSENELISFAITNEAGTTIVPLVPGDYRLEATKIGHKVINHKFSVTSNSQVVLTTIKPLTSLMFNIKETGTNQRPPVEIKFRGIEGTPDPFLGPTKRAKGANNFYYAINDKRAFQIPLPPGHYFIKISHGPEYDVIYKQVKIRSGETKMIKGRLTRSFETPQWIIADFHNHTARSGDNDSGVRSRVINIAAAGIEFAPATEHNRISSYSAIIRKLGLEEYLASAGGIELTGAPGGEYDPGSTNHQTAFPLKIQKGRQGGGFPGIVDDPYAQMKGLYDYDNKKFKFVQQNHPDIPWLYFDKDRDGIADGGFGTYKFTDALEIQDAIFKVLDVTSEKATKKNKRNRIFYWLQMLNQGYRIYGTVTSDNHNVGPRSGGRFMYVQTKYDSPKEISAIDIAKNAKRGHMVMSNGPFIKSDINGHSPGEELKDTQEDLKINIEVYANNEFKIDRVQLLVNGRQNKNLNYTKTSHPEFFNKNGGLQFKHTLPIEFKKDAQVIVVATGSSVSPKFKLRNNVKVRPPLAITNPFFIDVDGNGFKPTKGLLGEPLPVVEM